MTACLWALLAPVPPPSAAVLTGPNSGPPPADAQQYRDHFSKVADTKEWTTFGARAKHALAHIRPLQPAASRGPADGAAPVASSCRCAAFRPQPHPALPWPSPGYLHTAYGKRPLQEVMDQIDLWLAPGQAGFGDQIQGIWVRGRVRVLHAAPRAACSTMHARCGPVPWCQVRLQGPGDARMHTGGARAAPL